MRGIIWTGRGGFPEGAVEPPEPDFECAWCGERIDEDAAEEHDSEWYHPDCWVEQESA